MTDTPAAPADHVAPADQDAPAVQDAPAGRSHTRDLRLGVIGLGLRATLAKEAHRPGEGSVVVAAADTAPGMHARAREWFGDDVHVHPDHHRMLAAEDLDAVFLITPDHTHEALAVDLLAAGVAVFVEKPLAITTEGCDRVLEAARASGSRLYVGHNMRHMPVVRVMRDLIGRGEIGEVKAVWCRHFVGHGGDFYFKDWHADRRNTTSLLLQKGAHDLDVIHWLAGAYTERVTALGGLTVYGDITDRSGQAPGAVMPDWYDPERNWPPLSLTGLNPVVDVEDLSMMLMRLEGGIHASYQQCHYTPDYWRNYTVIGTEGRLENFGDHGESAEVRVWRHRSGYRADADLVVPMPSPGEGGHGGSDPMLVAEFLRFVRSGGPTDTSPVAAREAVAAGVAATESLRSDGRPVTVSRIAPDLAAWFARGQS